MGGAQSARPLRLFGRQALACVFSVSFCTLGVTPISFPVQMYCTVYNSLISVSHPDATSATLCVQTRTECLPFYIFIWMDAYDLVLLHKCTRVCLSAHFIVMKPTDSLGYISLGACQAALMPVAQRYVIVLSLQAHICMKRVTSGFLLHSINHLKQIRQRQIWLSLHQCAQ